MKANKHNSIKWSSEWNFSVHKFLKFFIYDQQELSKLGLISLYCVAAEHAERWHCENPICPSSSMCCFNLSLFSNSLSSLELSVTAVCVLIAFSLSYIYRQTKCSQTALYKNSMRCFVEPELLFHILNGMKCLVKNLYIDRKGSFTGFGLKSKLVVCVRHPWPW